MGLYSSGEILTATKLNRHFAVCQVHDSSQSLTDNLTTTITFDSDEQLDTHAWHLNGTNPTRVTPTINGWYRVYGRILTVSAVSTITRLAVVVQKNGAGSEAVNDKYPAAVSVQQSCEVASHLISMNGSTDYFELRAYQDDSGAASNAVESWMTVELVYPI